MLTTNDNRIRRYGLSPSFIALRGNQSGCNHFPSSWKFVRPDHLAFDHEPAGQTCPGFLHEPTPRTAGLGGSTPRYVSFTWWGSGTSAIDRTWMKILEVLVLRFQRIRACGINESQHQPVVPGILRKDFCALLYLNFFSYSCRAGGDRTG